jgi:hypothetical protein
MLVPLTSPRARTLASLAATLFTFSSAPGGIPATLFRSGPEVGRLRRMGRAVPAYQALPEDSRKNLKKTENGCPLFSALFDQPDGEIVEAERVRPNLPLHSALASLVCGLCRLRSRPLLGQIFGRVDSTLAGILIPCPGRLCKCSVYGIVRRVNQVALRGGPGSFSKRWSPVTA